MQLSFDLEKALRDGKIVKNSKIEMNSHIHNNDVTTVKTDIKRVFRRSLPILTGIDLLTNKRKP